jgi:hypothetical protein
VRALVLLLLLANLLFAAWAWWIAPSQPSASGRPTPVATDAGAIRLLREAPPSAGTGAAPDDAVDLNDAALACVSAGPYLERAQVEAVEARLRRLGFAVRVRDSHESVRTGEWVRVEDLATPEDAANALSQLQAAGIADAYLLGEEEAGNVISLGVFTDPARAREVSAVARAAGFEPRTVEREREADVFWLDIDRQASAGLPSTEQLGADAGQLPPLELRRCPAPDDVMPAPAATGPGAAGPAAGPASPPPNP